MAGLRKVNRFVSDTHQECNRCHEVKSLAEFHRESHTFNGYCCMCKPCKKKYRQAHGWWLTPKTSAVRRCGVCETEFDALFTVAGRRLQKASNRKFCSEWCMDAARTARVYRVNPKDWYVLTNAGNPSCVICGYTKNICWDHDHKDGHFRGLLCAGHNTALGLAGDDVEGLLALLTYLLEDGKRVGDFRNETILQDWITRHPSDRG